MKLNEKILYCRKNKGISQLDLADLLGVSRQSVSKWETGESNPDISKLPLLASTFGVTIDWLLSEDPPAESERCDEASASPLPSWIDTLPGGIHRMVKLYGWIYGLRIALGGVIFTIFGFAARLLFRKMIFGFDPIPTYGEVGNSLFPGYSDPFQSFNNQAWSIFSGFTAFIIGAGILLIILGSVLAFLLKRWGNNQTNNNRIQHESE